MGSQTQLARPLFTSVVNKARTEKEILEWVEKEKTKGWVSKGCSYHDKEDDFRTYHIVTFLSVGACVIGAWLFKYSPDQVPQLDDARSLPRIEREGVERAG